MARWRALLAAALAASLFLEVGPSALRSQISGSMGVVRAVAVEAEVEQHHHRLHLRRRMLLELGFAERGNYSPK
jgi:hypothetical protein